MEACIFDLALTLLIFKLASNTKLVNGFLCIMEGDECTSVQNHISIKELEAKNDKPICFSLTSKLKSGLEHAVNGVFFETFHELNEFACLSNESKKCLLKEARRLQTITNYYNKKKYKFCAFKPCVITDGNKKCGGCETVYYCSRNHQKKSWNEVHRYECKRQNC